MQVFVQKEELFFELTQTIMNKKDISSIDFGKLKQISAKTVDPMITQLNQLQGKDLVALFITECKIELLTTWIIQRFQRDLYSGITFDSVKSVMIHLHQNILTFLHFLFDKHFSNDAVAKKIQSI